MSGEFAPWVDLLTGALRREHFESLVSAAVKRARVTKAPLTMMWLDVDELCEHNDLHGRATLDGALGWLAAQLSDRMDGRGPIARVTGGAFAVLLENTTREEALALSQQLRRAIPRTLHSSAFGDFRLTVSVGIAHLRSTELWGNFLDAAEEACVRAKQGGRDTVVMR